ncbi:MAG: autotransporter outer membrane beta-barrel domain-containing protein [Planctomycetia bacterium]|nr:autotransporter outer membrane beta-barrel domain-containing protein [Planctomycetia bacterium]
MSDEKINIQKELACSMTKIQKHQLMIKWSVIGVFLFLLFILSALSYAQMGSQLTISSDNELSTLSPEINSIKFEGDFALTLINGSTLNPILLNTSSGAVLNLGKSGSSPQTWTISNGNSSSWYGTINLYSSNLLVVGSSNSNPLGKYSSTGTSGTFAFLNLNDGSTLKITSDTTMGALATISPTSTTTHSPANVEVAESKTLTVSNGVHVDSNVGLNKTGQGTMSLLANKDATFNLGNLAVSQGTFQMKDGSAKLNDATISIGTITVGSGAVLDIQKTGTVTLDGVSGTVFSAADNSTVNFYIGKDGYTSYQTASGSSGIIDLQATTLNIISDQTVNSETLTLFKAAGIMTSETDGKINLKIQDNILGKQYVLNSSDNDSIIVKLEKSNQFISSATTTNTKSMAHYLDNAIDNGNYSMSNYNMLNTLEQNPQLLSQLTGEIYASTIGFQFNNTYLMSHSLYEQLRNVPLITYNGTIPNTSTVNPVSNYATPDYSSYPTGGLDTAPYGTGYAPMYENGSIIDGANNTLNGGDPLYQSGIPTSSRFDPRQSVLRGQKYGDPGTMIYSAWVTALTGSGTMKHHNDFLGYEAEQLGGMLGLDLFGSTDCRFGLFGSYQQNKLKDTPNWYGKLETENYMLGLYHQFGDEFVYNIAMLAGGYNRFDTQRTISGAINDQLNGKTNSYQGLIGFERGANFQLAPFIVSPYGGVEYSYLYRDSMTETSTSNSGLALKIDSKSYHSLHTNLGARAILDLEPCTHRVRLVLRGQWTHEFLDYYDGKTNVSINSLPVAAGTFDVYGNSTGRDWAIIGGGLEWAPIPAFLLYANYDYLKNKYTSTNYGSAGLKLCW